MIEYKVEDSRIPGGQSCGIRLSTMIGKEEDLSIEIKCGYFKSQHKNREFIKELFKIAQEKLKQE